MECTKKFEPEGKPTFLKNYSQGEVFGELSLMYNAPRAATIVAKEESVCFCLDRDTFNAIVKQAAIKNRQKYHDFLIKIDILSGLDSYEKDKICDCLKQEIFQKDQQVIKEGEVGNRFYLIMEGTAKAVKTDKGVQNQVFEYKANDYFGELALLGDTNRQASIIATSDFLVVASLDLNSFKRLLGSIEPILMRQKDKYNKYKQQLVTK